VIGHYHNGMQKNPTAIFAQAMFEDEVAGCGREASASVDAECNE
jgi:hypothetical protein